MFDDLRKHATTDDQGQTKPNQLLANEIQPDPFTRILQSANLGFDQKPRGILDVDEIKLLEPDAVLDWPSDNEKRAANCDKAVQISKYLKAADFPIRDNLLNSARNSTPDWLKGDDDIGDLPSWLTASAGDKPFAQKGLPKETSNDIPDWMKEHGPDKVDQDIDLSEFSWEPDANTEKVEKKFDPNKTQPVKAYKKPKNVLRALLGIGAYIIFVNFAGSFFIGNFDDLIFDIIGVVFYYYMFNQGYELKFLLPHKK